METEREQEQDEQIEDERPERARGLLGSIGERVTRPLDRVSGAEFRREFERFTEAVSTTVVGVYHDQSAHAERLARLEAAVAAQSQPHERHDSARGAMLALGVVAVLALVLSIVALAG